MARLYRLKLLNEEKFAKKKKTVFNEGKGKYCYHFVSDISWSVIKVFEIDIGLTVRDESINFYQCRSQDDERCKKYRRKKIFFGVLTSNHRFIGLCALAWRLVVVFHLAFYLFYVFYVFSFSLSLSPFFPSRALYTSSNERDLKDIRINFVAENK